MIKCGPKLEITQNYSDWTKEDITLTIKATDECSGLKSVKVNGTALNINRGIGSYTISKNGTYQIVAIDNIGNQTNITKTFTIIDKIAPSIHVTRNTTEKTHENITLHIEALDEESGIQKLTIQKQGETQQTNITRTRRLCSI